MIKLIKSTSSEELQKGENTEMKQFRKSPIAIACYVISALFAVYFLFICVNTIITINQYYASYDMSAGFGETLGYIVQSGLSPLASTITVFMAGFILEEVRKLNPANWMTEDEIAEEKEAKKMAREAKQIAKGEAAKAKADAKAEAEAEARAEAQAEKLAQETETVEFSAVVAEDTEEIEAEAEELSETAEGAAEESAETAEEVAEASDETVKATDDTTAPIEE